MTKRKEKEFVVGVGPLSGDVYAGYVRSDGKGNLRYVGKRHIVTDRFIEAMIDWIGKDSSRIVVAENESGERLRHTFTLTTEKLRKKPRKKGS